ncbi:MAG: type VI secretion system ATPase TssH [Pseudomonadota bacterium]
MTEIQVETYLGKLNRTGYDAFLQSMRHARGDGTRHIEMAHLLFHALSAKDGDIAETLTAMKLDRGDALKELSAAINGFRKNVTEVPEISGGLSNMLRDAWTFATLYFGEVQIRTGHLLVAALSDDALKRELQRASPTLAKVSRDRLGAEARKVWANSDEDDQRPMDGSGLSSPAAGGDAPGGGSTALGRFAVDLTAQAESGELDPIVGRDEEIRQIIDILLRRRQNNPILTGEAGVGKTAVVEGFAHSLASGNVPPALKGIRLFMLDIGAMQAGASMKGEFEQRLRSVIDEVQASPVPIILFIDEAHTLIGAGGAQGTGDAANLLKPALARGTLRTIGATTWSEYRQYFEKDPALTRRFQPVEVAEPDPDRCAYMLRGILGPMEAHHGVRISDEAIVAAVNLSHRYVPARQLPDKAVSLLDTACARVAVSQATEPARIADLKASIAALEVEVAGKEGQRDLGETNETRREEAEDEIADLKVKLEDAEALYDRERKVVDEILALRARIAGQQADGDPDAPPEDAEGVPQAPPEDDAAPEGDTVTPEALAADDPNVAELSAKTAELDAGNPDDRMVYSHVDAQAVASVISDWTGIPAGRMVADEIAQVLTLADHLKERVVGQDHGLTAIAKRIETARAGLGNPQKPIGVFMLCGPSGVGKTETALALAESMYGGEQNTITINMSEFQEAHSVSLLKGAPPGYVGYGEGGRLTEAVRRKPYSVVLLDEVEKAHPDVHELFFQVFDKGIMEDGTGRSIDFKNTLILLTSNVGTDVIMEMADEGEAVPDFEELDTALKPFLTDVFPPALLGRIVTIPYLPLSRDVLRQITRLKLGSVVRRMKESHGAMLDYSDAVLDHIVEQCRDPASGGRMIDNVITNAILPGLSREILGRMADRKAMETVRIEMEDGQIAYAFG